MYYMAGKMRLRTDQGKFGMKGEHYRKVRSVRLTDEVWEKLTTVSKSRMMSVGDLLEQLVTDGWVDEWEQFDPESQVNHNGSGVRLNSGTEIKPSIVEELVQGLDRGGANQLNLDHRDKAPGRRTLLALLAYLKVKTSVQNR